MAAAACTLLGPGALPDDRLSPFLSHGLFGSSLLTNLAPGLAPPLHMLKNRAFDERGAAAIDVEAAGDGTVVEQTALQLYLQSLPAFCRQPPATLRAATGQVNALPLPPTSDEDGGGGGGDGDGEEGGVSAPVAPEHAISRDVWVLLHGDAGESPAGAGEGSAVGGDGDDEEKGGDADAEGGATGGAAKIDMDERALELVEAFGLGPVGCLKMLKDRYSSHPLFAKYACAVGHAAVDRGMYRVVDKWLVEVAGEVTPQVGHVERVEPMAPPAAEEGGKTR